MHRIDLRTLATKPITLFESKGAFSSHIASGSGDTHVHFLEIDPGGIIGSHPTGYAQILLVISGSGYASGNDGIRIDLSQGQAVYINRGELHSKGSHTGMTAIMIQVYDCEVLLE